MGTRRDDILTRARNIVNVNALVAGSLVIGLASNILIAGLFGLSYRVDAFFAAAVLPSLFMVLFVDYLGKNFLPVLARAKREGDGFASSVTSSIVTTVALLAMAVTALLVAFKEPVFSALLPGFDADAIALVGRYFTIMAPTIVLMAVNLFHEYVWQYEEQFTYVSLSRTAVPIANLLAIVTLAPWLEEYCLPVGYLVGHVAVFLLFLRRLPYRYRPIIAMRSSYERQVFANAAIVMSTGVLARSRSIVMSYLGSQLGSGAISALALASKITEPLERTAFTGIRMLMFSQTVRLSLASDRRRIGSLYSTGLRASFLVMAPLLWWMGVYSEELVQLLLVRGEFTPQMGTVVAGVLVALVPTVLFYGVNQLLSNAFYAMSQVKVPAIVMPSGTLVYIAVAVPLSAVLGIQALAMAATVAAVLVFSALLISLARQVPEIGLGRSAAELGLYAVLAGTAILGVTAGITRLGWPPLATTAAALPLGTAAYALALLLSGDRTFRTFLDLVRVYAARRSAVNSERNSKAPPAPKSD